MERSCDDDGDTSGRGLSGDGGEGRQPHCLAEKVEPDRKTEQLLRDGVVNGDPVTTAPAVECAEEGGEKL